MYNVSKSFINNINTVTDGKNNMAKRSTTLGPKKKSRHSKKTTKRLAVKRTMISKKKSK